MNDRVTSLHQNRRQASALAGAGFGFDNHNPILGDKAEKFFQPVDDRQTSEQRQFGKQIFLGEHCQSPKGKS
jgi:hypothetical protein